ncbi:nicotinate-nucleotide--dimethylbenzimidazole phosphoribosyltransferase [Mucilaginibacter sp. FT3.2]|uniref:nicotinate-nucleotide--dimethylbenzimidazole phosphoribosyltransferase n=1 Tax=Mucilaginibacter sp. FT3.2 TaxID=2723090 RepID=UPI0016085CBF|nr:nicotinate-nucleotide--dimethylbenzimidazole phosphoribosyltransferase [Mucilaginibacter sp. FT3.2]MBB6232913.1 nicotinate-nucleotide--dimethylbenzimidazole phosphoribosyltransferase [Mucilaginibacter sp. FT3.2]
MTIIKELQQKIDLKTKPIGALGTLEKLALLIGQVQNTLTPTLTKPNIVVFAGDHGITKEGVSAYPQEVTYQMVMNFLNGGAAINVFSKQHHINLKIVDAGVNFDFEPSEKLINAKIACGTKNFLKEKAMSKTQLAQCFDEAAKIVNEIFESKSNVIGFGEMGIGNTSSATMLMSYLCKLPIEKCVGRGTGLNDIQLENKISILKQAQAFHGEIEDPKEVLQTFGGFEIAQICGAMLAAFENKMLLLIDGFIASSAFLVAYQIKPEIINNAIFCHLSDEYGHQNLLSYLNVDPLLKLNMRLGEGTGCAVAYPIIESAVAFLNNMASFESAAVTNKQ